MWNPFRAARERAELERARDREMFLSAVREIVDVSNRNSEAMAAQAQMLQRFFDMFMTSEQTTCRTFTDEDEATMERMHWHTHGES